MDIYTMLSNVFNMWGIILFLIVLLPLCAMGEGYEQPTNNYKKKNKDEWEW